MKESFQKNKSESDRTYGGNYQLQENQVQKNTVNNTKGMLVFAFELKNLKTSSLVFQNKTKQQQQQQQKLQWGEKGREPKDYKGLKKLTL